MARPKLPPIMRLPGLQLVAIGKDSKGHVYFKFKTDDERHPDIVLLMTNATKVMYAYTVVESLDERTASVTTHYGPHGDPAKDPTDMSFVWPG